MQLWDKKVKRDEDLSDSEDEGEGGRRFEKDRGLESASKKPSGEASSMDISKAPSPTGSGSTGLDGAALGLSLDMPGASEGERRIGAGSRTAPPSFGGVEAAGLGIGAMAIIATPVELGVGGAEEGEVVEKAAEKDTDMEDSGLLLAGDGTR